MLTPPQVIYSRTMKDAECARLNCHDARFGLAVSSIGDVDLDGYQGQLKCLYFFSCYLVC